MHPHVRLAHCKFARCRASPHVITSWAHRSASVHQADPNPISCSSMDADGLIKHIKTMEEYAATAADKEMISKAQGTALATHIQKHIKFLSLIDANRVNQAIGNSSLASAEKEIAQAAIDDKIVLFSKQQMAITCDNQDKQ